MNTDLVRYRSEEAPRYRAEARPALAPSYHELAPQVRAAILSARRQLEQIQRPDGSWAGRHAGDTSLTIQLALLLVYLGREESELAERAVNAVLADQRDDGGWSRTMNVTADVSLSVQAYLALKASGQDGSRPHMRRARHAIRELGGADAADMTARLWLALFGQVSYDVCRGSDDEEFGRAAAAFLRCIAGRAGVI
jgi:squalene-hopene/tetraprenyl-beta-curcumene cyclase